MTPHIGVRVAPPTRAGRAWWRPRNMRGGRRVYRCMVSAWGHVGPVESGREAVLVSGAYTSGGCHIGRVGVSRGSYTLPSAAGCNRAWCSVPADEPQWCLAGPARSRGVSNGVGLGVGGPNRAGWYPRWPVWWAETHVGLGRSPAAPRRQALPAIQQIDLLCCLAWGPPSGPVLG